MTKLSQVLTLSIVVISFMEMTSLASFTMSSTAGLTQYDLAASRYSYIQVPIMDIVDFLSS
jgi:hypothetical protein